MKRRGFLLILSLLLTVLIAIIALGLLSLRRSGYATSMAGVEAAQARCLAIAGMEDIRVKLAKDPFYPTGVGDEQVVFSYTEAVTSLDDPGRRLGTYRVTVDRSHRDPEKVLRIESRGFVGGLRAEGAMFTIYGELDLSDFSFKVWREGTFPQL
ncbi:MAG: hypothetical protein KC910_00865 [Candidatus Eremiobacteraeota bacterium]|nr:hypothetical protein [Candidatus Eremiobacteraeota bacterium]